MHNEAAHTFCARKQKHLIVVDWIFLNNISSWQIDCYKTSSEMVPPPALQARQEPDLTLVLLFEMATLHHVDLLLCGVATF